MVPKMIPFPDRVLVIVIEFEPVSILPAVMFTVVAVTLLSKISVLVEMLLFSVNTLKVVAPVIEELFAPVN